MATTKTVFVLFGATGDLARRMVLPAFYTLAIEGLLPADWVLVGNGRGDVAHEDFRRRVHDALVEFGPHPDKGPWHEFEQRLLFAGGGFDTDSPGSLLDVIGDARRRLGSTAELVHYLAVPPQTFPELTKALGKHGLAAGARVVYEKPFGTSPKDFRSLNPHRARRAGRVAGLPDRPLPGQGGDAEPARDALRQRAVRGDVEPRAHRERADRRAGDPRRREPGRLLRRDRRRAGHARHPPVPGRRGDRHGAPGRPWRRRPAVRPGAGDPLVPAAGPG